MKDIHEYVVQVPCDQSEGGGRISQTLTFPHRGEGVWRGAKSAHALLEQPLTEIISRAIVQYLWLPSLQIHITLGTQNVFQ